MKFEALINAVHIDPKKGGVKIVLDVASHVSLDELTTLSPKDETIQVTFESAQTRLGDAEAPTTLKEKADHILERDSEEDKVVESGGPEQ